MGLEVGLWRHTAGVCVGVPGLGVGDAGAVVGAVGVGLGLAEAVLLCFFVAGGVGFFVGVGVGEGGQLTSERRLVMIDLASSRLSALMPSRTCRARYDGKSARGSRCCAR